MVDMTDTNHNQPSPGDIATAPTLVPRHRPNRLQQAAAWVGIVAGTVFVLATIFFTGFILGHQSGGGGHGGHQHRSSHSAAAPWMGMRHQHGPSESTRSPSESATTSTPHHP